MEREKNDTMEVASRNRRRRTWVKIVGALACIVVFVTTYALVLPAITLNKEPLCGIEEHTHTQACYGPAEPSTYSVLSCSLDSLDVHQHSPDCYGADGSLLCGYADYIVHVHDASCYDADGTLVCQLPEIYTHTHTSDCYTSAADAPTCQLPQIAVHTHTADCYDSGALVCGMLETRAHRHTDDCFQVMQAESEETVLTCTLEEHVHTEACYTEDASEPVSDPNADVETQEQWEATLYGIRLSGEYRQDILTVAYSQLGYSESSRNFVLDGDGNANGYTRYGAWYGDDCGEWCAMFVSFCLHYAGVPEADMPLAQNCETWIALLRKQERYFEADSAAPDGPVPAAGDLIFFSSDGSGVSDHVGLVTAYIPATETETAKVCTIEGNNANAVRTAEYDALDARILGYAQLPEQSFYCGKTGHTHSAACGMRACTLDEHIHTDACLDPAQEEFDFVLTAQTESGVTVTVSGAADALPYPADEITLTAAELQNEQADQLCRQALAEEGLSAEKNYLFDVCLWHGEEQIEPTGPLTLKFSGFADEAVDFKVYHIDEQADEATDMHAALDENGSVQLDTDHFSTYSVTPLAADDAEDLRTALQEGRDYTLPADVTFSSQIVVTDKVTLDLNGHTLTWTGGTYNGDSPIRVIKNNGRTGNLTIKDSSGAPIKATFGLSVPSFENDPEGFRAMVGSLANYEVKGKVLTYYVTESTANGGYTSETRKQNIVKLPDYGAIQCTAQAAPVCLIGVESGASLTISGGRFTNTYGETSILAQYGTVNIMGGYFCGNDKGGLTSGDGNNVAKYSQYGGAIRSIGGTLNITDGVIAGNIAARGGGVYKEGGVFTMSGGTIAGNLVSSVSITPFDPDDPDNRSVREENLLGGGVCINEATAEISGGSITNNRINCDGIRDDIGTYYMGGGIAQWGRTSTLNISGGATITGNYSNYAAGGGIGFAGKQFTMTGGKVASNYTFRGSGAGIRLERRLYGDKDNYAYDDATKYETHSISGGYITNNVLDSDFIWGGGGLILSEWLSLDLDKPYIVGNTANDFGGGVAGCPTGDVVAFTDKDGGAAIFDNKANANILWDENRSSNNWSTDESRYRPDVLDENYTDFFTVRSCVLSANMLGEQYAGWVGTNSATSGYKVEIKKITAFSGQTALTAHPTAEAKNIALQQAQVFITGNYSGTNGGGILSNGQLQIGNPKEAYFAPGLTINLDKQVLAADDTTSLPKSGQFNFLLLSKAPTKATNGKLTYDPTALIQSSKNNAEGKVCFDISYAEQEAATGTYTYYVMEEPKSDISAEDAGADFWHFDQTVYQLDVTVTKVDTTLQRPDGSGSIDLHYIYVSNIKVSLSNTDDYPYGSGDTDASVCVIQDALKYNEPATVLLRRKDKDTSFQNYTEKTRNYPMYLDVTKVDSSTGKPLSGATFTLRNAETPSVVVKRTSGLDGIASFALCEAPDAGETCTFWLEETEAPEGYQPAGPWIIEITGSDSDACTAKFYLADKQNNVLIQSTLLSTQLVSPSNQYLEFSYTVKNTPIPHPQQLRIAKTDGESLVPLAGVEFHWTYAGRNGYDYVFTEQDGTATFDVLLNDEDQATTSIWLWEMPYPNYQTGGPWIIDIQRWHENWDVSLYSARDGHEKGTLEQLSSTPVWTGTFTENESGDLLIELPIENFTNQKDTLRIHKVDSETGLPLPDVTFRLYDPQTKLNVTPSESVTDDNGDIEFPIKHLVNNNERNSYSYWLYEDKTPPGYHSAGPWVITITPDEQDGPVTASMYAAKVNADSTLIAQGQPLSQQSRQTGDNGSFYFSFRLENEPIPLKVRLEKIDSMTGAAMPNVAFKLCLPGEQESTDWKQTDQNGYVEFDIELPAEKSQEYWLIEQTPPDYTPAGPWVLTISSYGDKLSVSMEPYRANDDGTPITDKPLNTGTIGFTMDQTDNQITFSHTLSNTREGKLEIQKVDSVTRESLSGAIFNLAPAPLDDDPAVWTRYQTGEDGLARFTIDLPSGDAGDTSRDYWLTETPPANYNQAGPWILRITRHVTNNVVSYSAALYPAYLYGSELREQSNAQSESVAVTEDGDTFKASLTIENTNPTPNKLTLLKLDSLSGDLITDKVTFSLCRENDLGNRETLSGHGSLSFSIPTPAENSTDTYWLFEEQAPPGYTKAGPWIIDVYWDSDSGQYIADLYQATEDASGALQRQAEVISGDAAASGPFELKLDIENTPEPPYELWIKKVDSVTGAPMPDVLFMLTRLGQGQSIQQRTDQDGWAKFSISYDPENDGEGPHYLLEELTPPGYHTDGPWEFSCGLSMDEDGNERLELNLAGGDTLIKDETLSDSSKSVFVFEIKNTPNDQTIRIHKTDSATGASMPGVTFRLCLPDDPTNYLTVTTDETGDASFPLAKLPEPNETVTYWLFEEQQPGYLPAGPWVLEIIREDNQYHMIWYLAATDENGYPTNDPIEPETTIYPTDDPLYFAINIQNSPMPELPEAGGFPSVLYMLGGAAVLAGALAYMIRRRRRGRA